MDSGDMLYYKGYFTKPVYSSASRVFHGRIFGVDDMIDFKSDNSKELENEFRRVVDDYLDLCAMIGKAPNKKYNGEIIINIAPELHREAATFAQEKGLSLNRFIEQSIRTMMKPTQGKGNKLQSSSQRK